MIRNLLYFSLLALILVACKSKKEVSENTVDENQSSQDVDPQLLQMPPNDEEGQDKFQKNLHAQLADSVVARIQRTSCFGRCPTYVMTVFESGRVEFDGKKWVEKEGLYMADASQAKLKELMAMAQEVGFFEFNNEYDSKSVTDLPSCITTLKKKGAFKTVVSRYNAPESLLEFERFFDSLYSEVNWKKIASE